MAWNSWHDDKDDIPVKKVGEVFAIIALIAVLLYSNRNMFRVARPNSSVRYSEAPAYKSTVQSDGFDYRLTQIFIESEESKSVEDEIRLLFIEAEINYENLHHTDKGFYTAHIKGGERFEKEEDMERYIQNMGELINSIILEKRYSTLYEKQITFAYQYYYSASE